MFQDEEEIELGQMTGHAIIAHSSDKDTETELGGSPSTRRLPPLARRPLKSLAEISSDSEIELGQHPILVPLNLGADDAHTETELGSEPITSALVPVKNLFTLDDEHLHPKNTEEGTGTDSKQSKGSEENAVTTVDTESERFASAGAAQLPLPSCTDSVVSPSSTSPLTLVPSLEQPNLPAAAPPRSLFRGLPASVLAIAKFEAARRRAQERLVEEQRQLAVKEEREEAAAAEAATEAAKAAEEAEAAAVAARIAAPTTSPVPLEALESRGWVRCWTMEGTTTADGEDAGLIEYFVHRETGESQWAAYMDEVLQREFNAAHCDEGLGEMGAPDDFTRSPWVPPSLALAESRAQELSYSGSRGRYGLGLRRANTRRRQTKCWLRSNRGKEKKEEERHGTRRKATELSGPKVISWWAISTAEFRKYSTGVRLHFLTLKTLTLVFAILSLVHFPCLLLCWRGDGTARENRDPMYFYALSLGNVGNSGAGLQNLFLDEEEDDDDVNAAASDSNSKVSEASDEVEMVSWLGRPVPVKSLGVNFAYFACGGGVVLIAAWLHLRKETAVATKEDKEHVRGSSSHGIGGAQTLVSVADYTVLVTGVPRDVTVSDLLRFFSSLYDLEANESQDSHAASEKAPIEDSSHRHGRHHHHRHRKNGQHHHDGHQSGRRSNFGRYQPHRHLYGNSVNTRVPSTDHLYDRDTAAAAPYCVDSAVADVQLIFDDYQAVQTFLEHENLARALRRERAKAKMYAHDTPLLSGPDSKRELRALRREMQLTFKLSALAEKLGRKRALLHRDRGVIGALVTFNSVVAARRCIRDFRRLRWRNAIPGRQVLPRCCLPDLPAHLLFRPSSSSSSRRARRVRGERRKKLHRREKGLRTGKIRSPRGYRSSSSSADSTSGSSSSSSSSSEEEHDDEQKKGVAGRCLRKKSDGLVLRVSAAPAPEDILWENIHFLRKPFQRQLRRLLTAMAALLLLVVAAAVVAAFSVWSRRLEASVPSLELCRVTTKVPFLASEQVRIVILDQEAGRVANSSSSFAAVASSGVFTEGCEKVASLRLARPAFGSEMRKEWDAKCVEVLNDDDAFYATYSSSENKQDQGGAITVRKYANVSNYLELWESCRGGSAAGTADGEDKCPLPDFTSTEAPACPCVRTVASKAIANCRLVIHDSDSCEALSSSASSYSSSASSISNSATIPVHGSLFASCYCYDLMLANIERMGFLKGLRESVNSDSDRCTSIFRLHSTKYILELAKSLTTSLAALGLVHPLMMPRLVQWEGHFHAHSFEVQLLRSLTAAQFLSCIFVPLLIGLIASRHRDFLYVTVSQGSSYEAEIHGDEDERSNDDNVTERTSSLAASTSSVRREWFTDVGSGFLVTFFCIAAVEVGRPLWQTLVFIRRRAHVRGQFAKAEMDSGHGARVHNKGDVEADSYAFVSTRVRSWVMQADLDTIFQAPPFDVTPKAVTALTLAFIALLLGPVLPVLFPLATLAFASMFASQKLVVCRFSSRPRVKVDRRVQDETNRLLAWAIIGHMLVAAWAYGNPVLSTTIPGYDQYGAPKHRHRSDTTTAFYNLHDDVDSNNGDDSDGDIGATDTHNNDNDKDEDGNSGWLRVGILCDRLQGVIATVVEPLFTTDQGESIREKDDNDHDGDDNAVENNKNNNDGDGDDSLQGFALLPGNNKLVFRASLLPVLLAVCFAVFVLLLPSRALPGVAETFKVLQKCFCRRRRRRCRRRHRDGGVQKMKRTRSWKDIWRSSARIAVLASDEVITEEPEGGESQLATAKGSVSSRETENTNVAHTLQHNKNLQNDDRDDSDDEEDRNAEQALLCAEYRYLVVDPRPKFEREMLQVRRNSYECLEESANRIRAAGKKLVKRLNRRSGGGWRFSFEKLKQTLPATDGSQRRRRFSFSNSGNSRNNENHVGRGVLFKVHPTNGRPLKTWEVMKESGLYTYSRRAHPKYANAMKQLDERVAVIEDSIGDHEDGSERNTGASSQGDNKHNGKQQEISEFMMRIKGHHKLQVDLHRAARAAVNVRHFSESLSSSRASQPASGSDL